MLIILSPSKDMATTVVGNETHVVSSLPEFLGKAEKLMKQLRKRNPAVLSEQMKINPKLAEQNYLRFQRWNIDHISENSQHSILSYTGEAYRGLSAQDLTAGELNDAQSAMRILSGLYGVLRPLDLIQPYRLEIGLGIPFPGINSLYEYWSEVVTRSINKSIEESSGEKVLINLASAEYSTIINLKKLKYPVISPLFKEDKSGQLKMVTVYTKHARGAMTRFIIQNQLKSVEELKAFSEDGYYFENQLSGGGNLVFVR